MENNNSLNQTDPVILVTSGEQYKKDTQLLMKASILYEGAKKEIRELREENLRQAAIIQIMSGYMNESLEMFEMMFDSDEASFTPERMNEYIISSRYMEMRYGRKNISDRVEKKMNELPFN